MHLDRFKARTFRDLVVWQKGHQLAIDIYRYTSSFPRNETYGLSLQMRRAVVSIPANIAEGFKRKGRLDKARFMNIAAGSLEEIRYFLILSADLNYGSTDTHMKLLEEVSKLLHAYSRAILTSDS